MPKRRYRKALAALACAACLWALPAAAQASGPPAQTAETAAQDGAAGSAGGLGTAAGSALLIGAGAYSFVRRQWQEEREQQSAASEPYTYFENHTRNGTLRPEERDRLE